MVSQISLNIFFFSDKPGEIDSPTRSDKHVKMPAPAYGINERQIVDNLIFYGELINLSLLSSYF